MISCGSLMKCALVATVLVVLVADAAPEKLATCCKTVTDQEITEEVSGFMIQQANPPCVTAVIFQTKSGLYCAYVRAPWVRRKIAALQAAKSKSTPSPTVSLLSIITSTASAPSASAPSASAPSASAPLSTSEVPATDETPSKA